MDTPDGTRSGRVLLLGADVGGTRARARTHWTGSPEPGTVVEGDGWNPNSTDPGAADALLELLRAEVVRALDAVGPPDAEDPPVRVVAVLGIAGAGPARHAEVEERMRRGLAGTPHLAPDDVHVVDDMVTAFASGGVGPDGIALLAGTGAAAVRLRGHRPVARADGMGWLLGDVGSAVWIGRQVLEAVAADLDGRGPRTALTPRVLAHWGIDPEGPGDLRQHLIAAVYPTPPAGWGALAPLAEAMPEDAVARDVLRRAGEGLLSTLDRVRADADREVVLTGSVALRSSVVRGMLAAGLAERGLVGVEARGPVDGALRLARQEAGPPG